MHRSRPVLVFRPVPPALPCSRMDLARSADFGWRCPFGRLQRKSGFPTRPDAVPRRVAIGQSFWGGTGCEM